jgi:hypothetical protein
MKIIDLSIKQIEEFEIDNNELHLVICPKNKIKQVCGKFNIDDKTINDG